MQEAIGQVLSFAVVVAISPIPIVGVVLMLGTPRARSNGPAFLAGWLVGLAVVGVVVLLVAKGAGADDDGGASSGVGWLKVALGAVLIALAVRRWRTRPRGDGEPELPAWMRAVDEFTASRAAAMGVALSAVNPKNLIMTVGASVAIVQTGASAASRFVALAVFVAIGTVGVAAPLVMFFVSGERAARALEGTKTWLAAHSSAVMAVVLLVIGAKLLGDGISIV
ncbi:MAG TPA: GAP family protein [Capillimicrobium sp.]|nr:GAP family protein [Capillimicrobium sp.]